MKNEPLQKQRLLSPASMLSQPLRAYARQEELDASLHSSLCALRLIKTRTQVAQEMKLPAGLAEIGRYKIPYCF